MVVLILMDFIINGEITMDLKTHDLLILRQTELVSQENIFRQNMLVNFLYIMQRINGIRERLVIYGDEQVMIHEIGNDHVQMDTIFQPIVSGYLCIMIGCRHIKK